MKLESVRFEEQVDLKKMSKYILKKGVFLLLCTLIGTVALGCLSLGQYFLASSDSQEVVLNAADEETQQKLESYLRSQQMSENQAQIYEEQVAALEEMIESNDEKLKDFGSREALSDTEELTQAVLEMQQSSLANELALAKAQIEEAQRDAKDYQAKIEAIEKDLSTEQSSKHSLKRVVKMMIVGALLGFVFGVLIAGMRYMAKHTIEDEEELSRRYQLPVLASLKNENDEASYALLGAKLNLLAKSDQKLVICSSLSEKVLSPMASNLQEYLSFPVYTASAPLKNVQALQTLKGSQVLFVEGVRSLRNESDALAEFLAQTDLPVLGAVLVK
jgi:capsular polysaccharide biosynthesis protein